MNTAFSVYLDIVRFSAAVLVYLWHSNQRSLTESVLPASNFGHSSVIVFFVLSGFVIAYITDTKENTLSKYMASRISRVFSVAIPAVFLTLLLDSIGRGLYPQIYTNYPFDNFFVRVVSSLLMTNEIWFVSITTLSNVPYWSICYEWWYYIVFATFCFLPKSSAIAWGVGTLLLVGPKLILLAPIWWIGVLLYRWKAIELMPKTAFYAMFFVSLLGIVFFHSTDRHVEFANTLAAWFSPEVAKQLAFSKWFLVDYLLAILVFMNFAGVRGIVATSPLFLPAIQNPVRFVAGFTFSLYLLHQPLFLFWAAIVRGNPKTILFWVTITILTFLSVVAISFLTEAKRGRVKNWLEPKLSFLDSFSVQRSRKSV
jgi:peptidoglycan/LPS O-acetylase OafA/YrhL